MRYFKRVLSLLITLLMIISMLALGTFNASASGTGIGLSEWSLNAYYSGWSYVYGGSSPGAVDCSGLIYSYAGGYRTDFEPYTDYIGYVSNGIPNIHGLGLGTPTHYGVYVGNGMAVDARGSDYGVMYTSVYSRRWDQYFKIPGVSYPTTGWEIFNGDYYYYENGEYLADTSRTIDGITYNFASSGISDKTPDNTSATAPTSQTSSSGGSSSSNVLKKGSTGKDVVKLQQRLAELGFYTGDIDGSFGNGTYKAYISFQKAANVTVDGIAGPSDALILYSNSAPYAQAEAEESDPAEPQSEESVSDEKDESDIENVDESDDTSDINIQIQQRLSELNYYSGEIDGILGSGTMAALSKFQADNGLDVSGIADESTIEALLSDSAIENTTQPEPLKEAPAETIPPTEGYTEINTEIASEIIERTSVLSAKALANLTADLEITDLAVSSRNSDFVKWFFIILSTMLISFGIVLILEKIGDKKAASKKKAAARYKAAHVKKRK